MIPALPRVDRDFSVRDYVPGQPLPIMVRDPKTGRIQVNELKRWIKPYTLVTEPDEITLGPNQVSEPIPMVLDAKGHFEVMEAFYKTQQPEGFTVLIFDPGDRPLFMNREVHVSTIASGEGVATNYSAFGSVGSAGRPFKWPETFFMNTTEKGRAVFCQFRNLSSLENKIRFNLHGLRWYHMQAPAKVAARMAVIYREKFRSIPFFYTTENFVTLGGAKPATGTFDCRFTDEAWIEAMKLSRFSTGRFNCRIIEKSTTKRFMESAIRDDLVFGNGEFPFLMWESALFEPNYKISFELENLIGQQQNDIWLTVSCRKIFWDQKDDRLLRPEEAGGMP